MLYLQTTAALMEDTLTSVFAGRKTKATCQPDMTRGGKSVDHNSEFEILKFFMFENFHSGNPKNKNKKHLSNRDKYPL